jgi:hypothetical protein
MRRYALALALTLSAAPVLAVDVPLKDVPYVRDGIIATGIAYEISRVCDSIDARMIRGAMFLLSLKDHASDLGYSDAEIDAYINDQAEKDRLEAVARQILREMGAVEGQPETYCTVGRAEIAADTPVGHLLR